MSLLPRSHCHRARSRGGRKPSGCGVGPHVPKTGEVRWVASLWGFWGPRQHLLSYSRTTKGQQALGVPRSARGAHSRITQPGCLEGYEEL